MNWLPFSKRNPPPPSRQKTTRERAAAYIDKRYQRAKASIKYVAMGLLGSGPQGGAVSVPRRDDRTDNWDAILKPANVTSAIQGALEGQPLDLIDMFNRVRRSDLVLSGIIGTRLRAVRAAEWTIVSAAGVKNSTVPDDKKEIAGKAAEWVRDQLENHVFGFDRYLSDSLDAINFGVHVSELLWGVDGIYHTLSSIEPLNEKSVFGDPNEPWRLRVPTSDTDTTGVLVDDYPGKFVVHIPEPVGASPWGGGLFIPTTMAAVLKHLGLKWFVSFCERFGSPFIVGKYGEGSTSETIRKLQDAIKAFGYNGWATVPDTGEIEFKDAIKPGESLPQKSLMDAVDKQFAIGVLGQELTTQTSGSGGGAYALGQVHNLVRQDIRESDMRAEARTIRDQIIKPMIDYGPFRGAPIPHFTRVTPEVKNRKEEADLISVMINDLGMTVTQGQAADVLEFQLRDATKQDVPLEGRKTAVSPFGDPELGTLDRQRELDLLYKMALQFNVPITYGQIAEAAKIPLPLGTDPNTVADIQLVDQTSSTPDPSGTGNTPSLSFTATAAIPGITHPEAKKSPHAILSTWVEQAARRSRSQVEAVLATLRAGIKLGDDDRRLTHDDLKDVAEQINKLVPDLPTSELRRAAHSFILANQLVGYHNAQRIHMRFKATNRLIAADPSDALNELIGPFEEAVKALADRIKLPADVFLKLDRAARNRAGRVAGLFDARLVEKVYGELERITREGGTVADFRQSLRGESGELAGWVESRPAHVNLVFQQNATMAFQAGHYEQMQSVNVQAYKWRSYRDSCPICQPYIGKVFASDSTFPYPGGAHFGCDCWAEPVFDAKPGDAVDIRTVANDRWSESQRSAGALQFDPKEFGNLETLDLSNVPPGLRSSFERLVGG